MKILGIGFLSESSVCLLDNGRLKYAISEERINRVKNWWGNPHKAIKYLLKETGYSLKDIDKFATHGLSALKKDVPNKIHFKRKKNEILSSNLKHSQKISQIKFLKERYDHEINANKRVLNNIIELKKRYKNLEVFDHHEAHAASAYFSSKWKSCYTLTIDGWGDNSSSKLFKCNNGNLKEISRTNTIDSLGYFYGSITKLLGFKPHRHEGKILGLAAFGNPKKAYKFISQMISYDKMNKCFKGNFEKGIYQSKYDNPNLNFLKKKFKSKDIAAAAQRRLEEIIIEFIKDNIPINSKLALAGGVFANVKINQIISELKNINSIYVFPNMGDGGLSVGSALLAYHQNKKKYSPTKSESMYLGPKFSNSQVLKVLKKNKVNYKKFKNPEKFIAQKLNQGYVVACFQGRMEFGPRALGNRSILVNACNVSVNNWLNKKLKRTEFMPFAPLTLKIFSNKMYKDLKSKKKAINFMTTTVKCTSEAIKKSPAAVHVDKTARPQIISKMNNLKIFKILKEYYKISKIPNLINTSFNVHEEPIVCSPEDAIRAFKTSNLDYMYIEDYVVMRKSLI